MYYLNYIINSNCVTRAYKHPRRKKVVEGTIPGMGKEISNKEKLKKLSAQFGNLTFKIKLPKKD